ncbi:MAG: hypothetical protein P4M07_13430 [Xanthobacteraceae bacterium]|nr:hypothetical protein [Xanthobacteraceae bacterium]
MPAFSFEKLPPPARQEPAPAGPANSPSPTDPFAHVNSLSSSDYASTDDVRPRRGFMVQMLGRFAKPRPRQ